MRNDARPIGERSPGSPLGGDAPAPIESERPDSRDSVAHGRLSHVVNRAAEEARPQGPNDPVTPSSDAAPRGRI
jgi:hypothetical protein